MAVFPAHVFNPQAIKADVVPRLIDGGTAINGDSTEIQTDGGGRWEITYSGIVLRTPQMIRLWDAWTGYMPGQAFDVPLVSLLTAPRPATGLHPARPSEITGDDPMFPDSVAFAQPYIEAVTVGSAALRATQLTINVTRGALIQGGEKCSIGGRGFKIERVLSRAGQQAIVVVSPPARAAIPNGSAVNFDWPTVRCKLVMGQDLAPSLAFGKRAEMSISFVEDFRDV
ncbi:hypothetical protein [Sphingobium sp. CCH11-B1]|uniref:hypothetical protein n=1 Tax=Sphingobium sp. CCH11-B1 TaxID=1768781 RepID=UPI00082994CA|nr:hypothetical protein [Sphingobium sp. CCH11-B1]